MGGERLAEDQDRKAGLSGHQQRKRDHTHAYASGWAGWDGESRHAPATDKPAQGDDDRRFQ
jgi:hypothetical protein